MENKYQIGDKVRVINEHSWNADMEGIIIDIGYRSTTGYNYIVKIDESSQPMFYEKELVKLA